MKLEKAIQGLLDLKTRCDPLYMKKDIAAIQLGIEAMKARKERQDHLSPQLRSLLPGETKDDDS